PRLTDDSVQTSSHDDDLVEVQGARPSEPLLVRRGWLRDHLSKAPPLRRRARKRARPMFVPCDPLTGARLDPGDHLASNAYRPSDQLSALVRARDGRCRFPGCSITARFCDLDHVRPWPTGPTAARNLLTLCRRHHRIKQRPGWRLHLTPDGTATFTDPTGRQRTTTPVNALQALVLAADTVADSPAPPTADALSDGPGTATTWSALENQVQFLLEHARQPPRAQHPWLPSTHRRCTSTADLRAGLARRRATAAMTDAPPF
ncbi:MAG TPA: HNH endonuclease signature motif containing protein, partial [Ornithinibacter sp.]|nr:HNH endonuclease signature motif containing protein [Ornithinibacter sp.]